jgi:hypothetical protein
MDNDIAFLEQPGAEGVMMPMDGLIDLESLLRRHHDELAERLEKNARYVANLQKQLGIARSVIASLRAMILAQDKAKPVKEGPPPPPPHPPKDCPRAVEHRQPLTKRSLRKAKSMAVLVERPAGDLNKIENKKRVKLELFRGV